MNYFKKICKNKYRLIYLLFAMYILINLLFLTRFPFVHSDEPWLSGLSRNMADKGSFSVTETFFNLYIRNPHAIKIIFHTMQIIFMKIFGYQIFSFRLLSFIFGIMILYFQYKLCLVLFESKAKALWSVLFLAVDVQFIYASHFARQEIVILFVLILSLYLFIKNFDSYSIKHDIILGSLIGLSIGIHPNSFIISLPFVLIYIYHIFILRTFKLKNLIFYICTVAVFAAFFVILSLSFDPNFFYDYAKYGEQFDVQSPVTSKIMEVKDFYLKLFYGVSGTYYTPDIRIQFFLFPAALLISLFKLYRNRGSRENEGITAVILSIIAINAGIIIIGRYNQTSIVFIFPMFYILVIYAISGLKRYYKTAAAMAIAAILCIITVYNSMPYITSSYDNYLNEISKSLKKGDTVLANLNADYYFDNGSLFDYRNLSFLKDDNISFKDYIRKNKIQYIIYPEEMDLIYSQRPKWDGLYGELSYYNEMQSFFKDNCRLIYEFTDRVYGMRIVRYINTKDWNIKIYKVQSLE